MRIAILHIALFAKNNSLKKCKNLVVFLVDFDQDDDWDSVAVKFSELGQKLHISSSLF